MSEIASASAYSRRTSSAALSTFLAKPDKHVRHLIEITPFSPSDLAARFTPLAEPFCFDSLTVVAVLACRWQLAEPSGASAKA